MIGCLTCKKEVLFTVCWCSINCKKEFYLKYFAGNSDVKLWEKESDKEFRRKQLIVMKEIKDSGLSVREFLLSLGDFKDDASGRQRE